MKNKKLKRLTWIYALRGFVFGLLVTLIVLLFAADADSYHNSQRTFTDFINSFPAFWIVILLPLLTALAGFLLARQMVHKVWSRDPWKSSRPKLS